MLKTITYSLTILLLSTSITLASEEDFSRANSLINEGRYEEAIKILQTLPDSLKKNMSLAVAYLQLERYAEAENSLLKVTGESPDYVPAIYSLAMLYEKKKIYDKALVEWEKVLSLTDKENLKVLAEKHIENINKRMLELKK